VSTFGKVIKRGWDWLGVTPQAPEMVGGLVEAPALAACLTLNKADFLRSGPRGAVYLAYRKAMQQAVAQQLTIWGGERDTLEPARRRAARPVERDVESVLLDLATEFPMLAMLVERRSGGQRKLPMGQPDGTDADQRQLLLPEDRAADAVVQEVAEPPGRSPPAVWADDCRSSGDQVEPPSGRPTRARPTMEPPRARSLVLATRAAVASAPPPRGWRCHQFEVGRRPEPAVWSDDSLVNTARPPTSGPSHRGLPPRAVGGDGASGMAVAGSEQFMAASWRDRASPPPAKGRADAAEMMCRSGRILSRCGRAGQRCYSVP
jgi:hypothetical protein